MNSLPRPVDHYVPSNVSSLNEKYFVWEMFNFVIVTFIDGSLGEVSIKSTVANRNGSLENCTNSHKPNSKFYILNLIHVYLT